MDVCNAWLNALPVLSLDLCMDYNTIRVTGSLHLGSALCRPHTCHHCSVEVDSTATLVLRTRRSCVFVVGKERSSFPSQTAKPQERPVRETNCYTWPQL